MLGALAAAGLPYLLPSLAGSAHGAAYQVAPTILRELGARHEAEERPFDPERPGDWRGSAAAT